MSSHNDSTLISYLSAAIHEGGLQLSGEDLDSVAVIMKKLVKSISDIESTVDPLKLAVELGRFLLLAIQSDDRDVTRLYPSGLLAVTWRKLLSFPRDYCKLCLVLTAGTPSDTIEERIINYNSHIEFLGTEQVKEREKFTLLAYTSLFKRQVPQEIWMTPRQNKTVAITPLKRPRRSSRFDDDEFEYGSEGETEDGDKEHGEPGDPMAKRRRLTHTTTDSKITGSTESMLLESDDGPAVSVDPVGRKGCLDGLGFILLGIFERCHQQDIRALIIKYGGSVMQNVTTKLDYLVVGSSLSDGRPVRGGYHYKLAVEKGVAIIDESTFLEMIRKSTDPAAAVETLSSKVEVKVDETADQVMKDPEPAGHSSIESASEMTAVVGAVQSSIKSVTDATTPVSEAVSDATEAVLKMSTSHPSIPHATHTVTPELHSDELSASTISCAVTDSTVAPASISGQRIKITAYDERTGDYIELSVRHESSISKLKSALAKSSDLPDAAEFTLCLAGRKLNDSETLQSEGVNNGAEIQMRFANHIEGMISIPRSETPASDLAECPPPLPYQIRWPGVPDPTNMQSPFVTVKCHCLRGSYFVNVGIMERLTRKQAELMIYEHGGTHPSLQTARVTKQVTHLLIGPYTQRGSIPVQLTRAYKDARDLGIVILDEYAFLKLLDHEAVGGSEGTGLAGHELPPPAVISGPPGTVGLHVTLQSTGATMHVHVKPSKVVLSVLRAIAKALGLVPEEYCLFLERSDGAISGDALDLNMSLLHYGIDGETRLVMSNRATA